MDKESQKEIINECGYTLEEKRDQSIRKRTPKSLKN